MKRIIVDVSSLIWTSLLKGKDEAFGVKVAHNGREVFVNSADYGVENALGFIVECMDRFNVSTQDVILVVEGVYSKARRKLILPQYKESRDSRPDLAYENFNTCVKRVSNMFRAAGGAVCKQDGVESDDVIAYLAQTLQGEKIILSNDGDLAILVGLNDTHQYRMGELDLNPIEPAGRAFITLHKGLVGDSSDNIPGAKGFGPKAWLDLLAAYDDNGLEDLRALFEAEHEHLSRTGRVSGEFLGALAEDASYFKPFNKVLADIPMAVQSYAAAKLYPEWINTSRMPLQWAKPCETPILDDRIARFYREASAPKPWDGEVKAPTPLPQREKAAEFSCTKKPFAVFDIELIGTHNPVFLVCVKEVETGVRKSFWAHVPGDMDRLKAEFQRDDVTFVSFNGIHFDQPVLAAAVDGMSPLKLKRLSQDLIDGTIRYWQASKEYGFEWLSFDHIDLYEVAPGVQISLKTYAGRLGYKTMVDMPFGHEQDLAPEQLPILESYCWNDVGVTEELLSRLLVEVDLRIEMSNEYGIDLRSKSDAQCAEAVLKKRCEIGRNKDVPSFVKYKAPDFIQTDSPVIKQVVELLEQTRFRVNSSNGAIEVPDWLKPEIKLGYGTYQMGIGGLHSTHDIKLHLKAGARAKLSDFDVAGYYPCLMIKGGLIPKLAGGKGERFLAEYTELFVRRVTAKRAKNKRLANGLKIFLNGTFGKLGSIFSDIYSPEVMLGVTLTGQLNLLCLIYEVEKTGAVIVSANTDGIMVYYTEEQREAVLSAVLENAKRTGFEYEETPYSQIALKDVNNYMAVTVASEAVIISPDGEIKRGVGDDGKVKRKGLYASNKQSENPLFLMKNPTMEVCSSMVADYLTKGVHPRDSIHNHRDPRDFVAIRNVKGGGIQHERVVEVDDWELVLDLGTAANEWRRKGRPEKVVRRKSRPKPVRVGVGGVPFGKVARWYMTKDALPPLAYMESGNTVPKTEGARICMTLPDELPQDIDLEWYVNESLSMLADMGVNLEEVEHEQEV